MVREKCHTSCQKDSQTGKYHESICLVITLSDISGSPPQSSMLTGSSVGGAWCSPETCTNSHMHTHIHTRAFSWSSSKEPNKTFTTWLSLPPHFTLNLLLWLVLYLSFSLSLRSHDSLCCNESGLLSELRPFLSLGSVNDPGLNTFN